MPPTNLLVDFLNFFSRSPMLSIASQVRYERLDEHDKCHWGAMMNCTGKAEQEEAKMPVLVGDKKISGL
jgi:hypothetical protein